MTHAECLLFVRCWELDLTWSRLAAYHQQHNAAHAAVLTVFAGAVGVMLHGPICIDTLMSAGLRGVGPVKQVTSAMGDAILSLDNEPIHTAV